MRRNHTGHEWTILGLLLALLAMLLWLSGCGFAIPVRAMPSDEPILVAPVGEAGGVTMNAKLPQPDPAKFPAAGTVSGGWSMLWTAGISLIVGGAGVAFPALRAINLRGTALAIATNLADHLAQADNDTDVERAKQAATQAQEAAGVRTLTQRIRGKV